jgi:hypothetical protein
MAKDRVRIARRVRPKASPQVRADAKPSKLLPPDEYGVRRRKPLIDQFNEKWVLESTPPRLVNGEIADEPCWRWVGANNGKGPVNSYGIFGRPKQYAHRFSYTYHKGPIPKGYVIDHLCRHRWCVNPSHLDCVKNVTNLKRGSHPNFVAQRLGKCARGLHDLNDPQNQYLRADGRAFCKPCLLAAKARREEAKKRGARPKGKARRPERRQDSAPNSWGLLT